MSQLNDLIEDVVTANRILAKQGIVDTFGHVSVRHPDNPKRFLLARARAPGQPRPLGPRRGRPGIALDSMAHSLETTPVSH